MPTQKTLIKKMCAIVCNKKTEKINRAKKGGRGKDNKKKGGANRNKKHHTQF